MAVKKYPGLLTTEGDKHQALYRGLMDFGQGMAQGYSDKPISLMQRFTQGGAAGMGGYQDSIAQAKQAQLDEQKYQSGQAQIEQQQMQIEKAKQDKIKADELRLLGERYRIQMEAGDHVPGSVAAANYQSAMTPADALLLKQDPTAFAAQQRSTAAATAAANKKHERLLEIERIKANAKGNEKSILSAKDKLELGNKAYNQFNKDNAANLGRMEGYRGLEAIYTDPSSSSEFQSISDSGQVTIDGKVFSAKGQGAQDMALIFAVMKMLDPGSTVREGEFGLAANVGGKAKAMMNSFTKLWEGDQLPDSARQSLMSLARGQYDEAKSAVSQNLLAAKSRMGKRMPSLNVETEFEGVIPPYTPKFDASVFAKKKKKNLGGGGENLPSDLIPKVK